MNDETLALVKRALAGDSAAFSQLAEEHRRVAAGVAYGILSDAHLAADAVQDAFLKAFQKLTQLNEPEAFPAWFLNIVRASAIDIVRRRRRWGSQEVALADEAIAPGEGAAARQPVGSTSPASPPEALVRAEDAGQIRAALSDLSAEYREVIILKHLEGRSYRQIARLLKTSVRSVESKLFRARQQLSRSLRAKGVRAARMPVWSGDTGPEAGAPEDAPCAVRGAAVEDGAGSWEGAGKGKGHGATVAPGEVGALKLRNGRLPRARSWIDVGSPPTMDVDADP